MVWGCEKLTIHFILRGLAEGATRHFQQQQDQQQTSAPPPPPPQAAPPGLFSSTPFKDLAAPGGGAAKGANGSNGGGILAARLSKFNEAAAAAGLAGFPNPLFDFDMQAMLPRQPAMAQQQQLHMPTAKRRADGGKKDHSRKVIIRQPRS